jgi:hypothetical protein
MDWGRGWMDGKVGRIGHEEEFEFIFVGWIGLLGT